MSYGGCNFTVACPNPCVHVKLVAVLGSFTSNVFGGQAYNFLFNQPRDEMFKFVPRAGLRRGSRNLEPKAQSPEA